MDRKKCKSCKRELAVSEFGTLRSSSDGLNPSCKPCRRTIRRASYHRRANQAPEKFPAQKSLKSENETLISTVIGGFSFKEGEIYSMIFANDLNDPKRNGFVRFWVEPEYLSNVNAKLYLSGRLEIYYDGHIEDIFEWEWTPENTPSFLGRYLSDRDLEASVPTE